MVDAIANLSGGGPQQVWVQHRRVAQDQAGNYSQDYVEVRYYGNGAGAWINSNLYWSASVSGWHVAGSFTIPQSARYDTYTVLYAGYYNRAHDAAGNLVAFGGEATINGNVHSSIGSGTAYFTEPAAPRIPKRPSAPPFSFDSITANSFRVVASAPADNGGSPIDQYLIRVSNQAQADTPGAYVDFPGGGTQTITGREPGTKYYVTVYAHNGSADSGGYSTYQASKAVDTLSGVYVSDGSSWVATSARVSDGAAWDTPLPQISDGDSWEDPINV